MASFLVGMAVNHACVNRTTVLVNTDKVVDDLHR
jgi:hypothetical protein